MRIGLFVSTRGGCSLGEALERIQRTEAEGFRTAWVGQLDDFDALSLLALAGRITHRIELGTWVVPSYPRHPLVLAQQALTIQAASGNRLTLAIGVSHRAIIERRLGLDFSAPARHMRGYLRALQPLLRGESLAGGEERASLSARIERPDAVPPPLLLAALGPAMLRLAGARADGAALWLGGRAYLEKFALPRLGAAAREAGRPWPRIVCGLPIAVTSRREQARISAARFLDPSAKLPSYRRVLERGGASEAADVAILGDEDEVIARLRELAALGVSDLNAVLFEIEGEREAHARTRRLLAELARAGL